jgi:hypothetical protein
MLLKILLHQFVVALIYGNMSDARPKSLSEAVFVTSYLQLDVRFGAVYGLTSDIAACPKSAKIGSAGNKSRNEKAPKAALNSNPPIVVHSAAICGSESALG